MDSILSLEQIIQVIHAFLVSSGCHDAFMTGTLRTVIRTTMKSLVIAGSALTLYDHLLMIDDEIRYMWRGPKTFIFYLYTLNRIPLIAFRLWHIYVASSPRSSVAGCIAGARADTIVALFFFSSSDVFIALRVYAVTFGNKPVAMYFGTLALARLALSLVAVFLRPVELLDLPPIPIDAFNMCPIYARYQLRYAAGTVGTVFDLSAFVIIAWCAYRNMDALKLSAVIRTIVTEGTIYFLAMLTLQIYVQISLALMEDVSQGYSMTAYGVINPMLTMRFALSLKRSADSRQEWKSAQLTSDNFSSGPLSAVRVSSAYEMGRVCRLKD